MALKSVPDQDVADRVTVELREATCSGELAPGETTPCTHGRTPAFYGHSAVLHVRVGTRAEPGGRRVSPGAATYYLARA